MGASGKRTSSSNRISRIVLHPPSLELNICHLKKLEHLIMKDDIISERLARVLALVDRCRQKQKKLQKQIFVQRAIISAVRWVPVEIWEHIFGFVAAIDPDQVLLIGRVCTTWRDISLRPQFWRKLVISQESLRQEEKVQLFHKRSTDRSGVSQVTYVQPSNMIDPSRWGAWSLLRLFTERSLESFEVTFQNSATACQAFPYIGPMLNLKDLSLTIRDRNINTNNEEYCGFQYYNQTTLPCLKSLTLTIFLVPWPSDVLSNLTSLHIIDNFSNIAINPHQLHPMQGMDIIIFLQSCNALQEFILDAKGSYRLYTDTELDDALWPPLKLDFLRRLVLQCHYSIGHDFMRHLNASDSLQSATLRFYPRQLTHSNYALSEDIVAFGLGHKALRSLTLHGLDVSVPVSIGVLSFEHLEELQLEHSLNFEKFARRFGTTQSVEVHRPEPFWIAPRLSRLTLIAYPGDVPFEKMAGVVRERHFSNVSKGVPARIEHFEVNGQDLLKGAAPGETVAYLRPKYFQFVKKKQLVP